MQKMISFVICSIDQEKLAALTKNLAEVLGAEVYEIVAILDARSLSEGYNRGFARSHGDVVVFCHDDIEILTPDFGRKLRNYLNVYDVVGVAGTTCLIDAKWLAAGQPHVHGHVIHVAPASGEFEISVYGARSTVVKHIQALDGLFIAVKRKVLDVVMFDEVIFDGFHGYDVDFTFSAYLRGFRLAVCNDLNLIHQSGGHFGAEWAVYQERFLVKHGDALKKRPVQDVQLASLKVKSRQEVLSYCTPEILREVSMKFTAPA